MTIQPPILITGIPRSGTSIVAATIGQCGVFIGEIFKRSMYENCGIKDRIVKPYFERIGKDPNGQFPLPETKDLSIPVDWKKKVEGIILKQGYDKSVPWMFKSTTMGLIWPVWYNAFPNAKWIIVRRRTGDVIQSCLKTGYMSAFSDEQGWLEWVHEYEKRFVEMIEAGVNCKVIWPERMVMRDYEQMKETLEWLGLQWTDELKNFIDPLLWTSRKKERRERLCQE